MIILWLRKYQLAEQLQKCILTCSVAHTNILPLSFLLEMFANLTTSFNIRKAVTVTVIASRSIFITGAMITFHSYPETALLTGSVCKTSYTIIYLCFLGQKEQLESYLLTDLNLLLKLIFASENCSLTVSIP